MRIANCSGFYGDRLSAALEQVEGGDIDVLCGDYLAELTMSLLVRDRMRDSSLGYARTFLLQLRQVLAPCLDRGVRIVVNAGGLNPEGLAAAARELATELGLSPSIAWVEGDAVQAQVGRWMAAGRPLAHLDTGQALASSGGMPISANAYLGCWPIVQALEAGADLVITGRCTDAAVVMAPAAWRYGWKRDDYDALAGALVAGHIIECGAQATGGNHPFYERVPGLGRVGFPIAEIAADGSSIITKHDNTAGLVDVDSVTAQLLYEIGSPHYVSPDVIADFGSVSVTQHAPDQVAVAPVRGLTPPQTLKVGLNVTAGFRNQVKVLLGGPKLRDKANRVSEAFWVAVGGKDRFLDTREELIGGSENPETPTDALGVLLLSARAETKDAVARSFTSAAVEMALGSVPGLTLLDPPSSPRPCIQFWPVAVDRDEVPVVVHVDNKATPFERTPLRGAGRPQVSPIVVGNYTPVSCRNAPLGEVAAARSGDKAGKVNIGIWVTEDDRMPWLLHTVTEAQVAAWLDVSIDRVDVYPLPNLRAVNVVVHHWLGLGVGASLAADAQGKCLAEFIRTRLVGIPEAWAVVGED
ncbi:MAG: hypothetical protein ACJAZO_004340 [Myxococcota bacterium]|jgi:hypothetical protein